MLIHPSILSFSVPSCCVGYGRMRGSERSMQSGASHGGDDPPLREHDGRILSIRYYWRGGWLAVGDAETPWHPLFFRPVNLESQRWTEDGELWPTAQ